MPHEGFHAHIFAVCKHSIFCSKARVFAKQKESVLNINCLYRFSNELVVSLFI